MNKLIFKQLHNAVKNYDLILFDLWGVIIEDGQLYEGAVDSVNKILQEKEVIFLTNAPRPNFKVAENLGKWGLKGVTQDMVVTSGDLTRQALVEKRISNGGKLPLIYHLGKEQNDDILSKFEHKLTDDLSEAEILLLSLYRDDHEDVNELDDLLAKAASMNGLLTICANPDTIIPKSGALRYCAGYFAQKMEEFGGKVLYTGKPKKPIYDFIFKHKNNITKDRILMVGDTFETDILGAQDSGIHSALVLSGNAKPFHNMHKSMEDKLEALTKQAKKAQAMPNFVTSIT